MKLKAQQLSLSQGHLNCAMKEQKKGGEKVAVVKNTKFQTENIKITGPGKFASDKIRKKGKRKSSCS